MKKVRRQRNLALAISAACLFGGNELESELVHCSKELGLNSSSKLLRSRNESTRVSGFVLIRLVARAMKHNFGN